MIGLRATLVSAVLGATAAVPVVAVTNTPGPDTPPAVAMAVAARAACPALAGDSEKVATVVAIGLAESGGNADAIGDVSLEDSTWGPSVGWYQVRSLWDQDNTGGERDRTKLTDPAFNSLSMCSISRGGTYWQPWSTYTNGAYASYLTEARQAAATAMGVDVSAANASTATPAAADQGCTAPGGRSLGAIADRLWCNAIVRPWLALGAKPENKSWWSKLDGWIFGAPSAPKAAKGQPASMSAGGVTCPVVDGLEVGDGWGAARTGHTHQGIDLFGTAGSPIVSPFDGDVIEVQLDEAAGGLGGRDVVIRATAGPLAGYEIYNAHIDTATVQPGQHVKAGQQVATVGNTGNAEGGATHDHVQIYPPGRSSPVPAGATIGAACGKNPDPAGGTA